MSSDTGPPGPENVAPRLDTEAARKVDDDDSEHIVHLEVPDKTDPLPSRIRTFKHRFKGGITCKLAVDLDKLAAKAADPMRCEWSARPKPRVIPEYRRWILSVWQHVADETGLKTMELLQVKRHVWEAWVFEPGRPPVKVEEITT